MTLSGILALHSSCLRFLPEKHLIISIMELLQKQSLTLNTGDIKQSRISRLKNGVPQGLVGAPLLFNLFIFTSTAALHNFLKVFPAQTISYSYKSRHDHNFSVSSDLEAEALSHQDGGSSLSFKQGVIST